MLPNVVARDAQHHENDETIASNRARHLGRYAAHSASDSSEDVWDTYVSLR